MLTSTMLVLTLCLFPLVDKRVAGKTVLCLVNACHT